MLTRPLEGKRAYVTGDRLYEFIKFCEKNLPRDATYDLAIATEGDVEIAKMRSVYYLYPRIREKRADFMLVCDLPDIKEAGYGVFKKLDDTRYVLKMKGK